MIIATCIVGLILVVGRLAVGWYLPRGMKPSDSEEETAREA
jgi:hypothetical protein